MARLDRPLRVLVVDDEALIRWAVSETLTQAGHEVFEARDGQSAVQAMDSAARPFDVVLLDLKLPDCNDLTLLSRIRSQSPDSAVVMMTAYATSEVVAEASAHGGVRSDGQAIRCQRLRTGGAARRRGQPRARVLVVEAARRAALDDRHDRDGRRRTGAGRLRHDGRWLPRRPGSRLHAISDLRLGRAGRVSGGRSAARQEPDLPRSSPRRGREAAGGQGLRTRGHGPPSTADSFPCQHRSPAERQHGGCPLRLLRV